MQNLHNPVGVTMQGLAPMILMTCLDSSKPYENTGRMQEGDIAANKIFLSDRNVPKIVDVCEEALDHIAPLYSCVS